MKGAWEAPAALELFEHALAPVARLPVREVISGVHIMADLTLGLGEVVAGREGGQLGVGDWHYILPESFAKISAARRPAASVVATRAGHDRV